MTPPTAADHVEAAKAKLTVREYGALRAALRREVAADLAAQGRTKAPRVRELPEVASAASRMIRAVGQRAASDVEGLADLARLRDEVDRHLGIAARAAVAGSGLSNGRYSWADVGRVLGISRQSAHERFGKAPDVT